MNSGRVGAWRQNWPFFLCWRMGLFTAASSDVLGCWQARGDKPPDQCFAGRLALPLQAPSSSLGAYTAFCSFRCEGRCKDASNVLRSSARPRDRRDITVPMAVPVVSAISR